MNITAEDFFVIWIFISGVISVYYVRVCYQGSDEKISHFLAAVWDQAVHRGTLNEHPPSTAWETSGVIAVSQSIDMILHKQQLINLHKTPVHKVWTQFNKRENQHM